MKSFLTRLFTSVFILIIFAGMTAASFFDGVFEFVISLISMMCVYEVVNAMGFAKNKRFLVPSMMYAFLVPVSFVALNYIQKSPYYLIIVLTFVYMLTFLFISMVNFDKMKFNDAAVIMFASLVITCFLSNIIILRRVDNHGLFYMLLVIVCYAWANDIFAYLVGMCIGKHKLIPQISPKKTVEGSLGGIVFSLIATIVALLIYQNVAEITINFTLVIIYSLLCAVIGQIGDLSFSYIKRSYGIKDFGNILPGHGGVLDRLDSLIFISPFFYMLINISSFIS